MTTTEMGRIVLEELARLPAFYMPALNWQGDRVAFYWDVSGSLELYILDLPDGQPRQVSHGGLPKSVHAGFSWNRAGDRIVYARDNDGDEQHDLVALDLASGATSKLTSDPTCQEYPIAFAPGDAWLLVSTNKAGQLNLWRMRPDGSEYQQLTRYTSAVFGGAWSPDGKHIAYSANEAADLRNADIYIMNADGSDQRLVLHVADASREMVADWSPDGRTLLIRSDASGVNRPGLFDIESGAVRWLGEAGVEHGGGGFSHDGQSILCWRNQDAQIDLLLFDAASGRSRALMLPPGVVSYAEIALADRAVLFSATRPTARAGLDLYTLVDDSTRTVLAPAYGRIDPALFVDCEYVWYPSSDGQRIPALLWRPRQTAPGARLPAIVHVHGGPTAQWLRGWDPYAQVFTDRGYVVLEPNPRGSTGYGVEFRDAALRDWGGVDLEDVAAGAEYLKTLPDVDPARLGVYGGSYGGYMTYLITVKKPDLFKAGVAWVGMSDLLRLYDASMAHFKYYLRQQMGDPAERRENWHERSAINFMEQLRTKLLIVHGINDPRCPIEQARMVRDRLLALGRREGEDFEYVELSQEGHGSTDQGQKVRAYSLLVDFLERNL